MRALNAGGAKKLLKSVMATLPKMTLVVDALDVYQGVVSSGIV